VQLYRYFVSFAAITLCVASQRVFIVVIVVVVYFVIVSVQKLLDTPSYMLTYTKLLTYFILIMSKYFSELLIFNHEMICIII
jgi:hypothetical protein